MRWKSGLAIAGMVSLLIGSAAAFRLLAPDGYGLPKIEVLDPGPSGIRIEDDGVFGNYFPATGGGSHPGMLVLGGSEGGLGRATLHMALALQQEGFSVLQLAYFGAPGTDGSLERVPLERFDRGLDWLRAQKDIDADRLAVIGASKGAEAALLVATRHPELRAIVAGMPASVTWKGLNRQGSGQTRFASWTSEGVELATMPYATWNPAEGVISVYRSVEDPLMRDAAELAAIRIERARAPILLVCGQAETMWPACPMSRALQARAVEKGGPEIAVLAYENAGHLVFGPPLAPDHEFYERLDMLGGTVDGNAAARADSWPRVISFLRAVMAPEPATSN